MNFEIFSCCSAIILIIRDEIIRNDFFTFLEKYLLKIKINYQKIF